MSHDPDALAVLLVQQYLDEMGYASGENTMHMSFFRYSFILSHFQSRPASCAALHELERQHGLKYVPDKLPKGSMLLEVCATL